MSAAPVPVRRPSRDRYPLRPAAGLAALFAAAFATGEVRAQAAPSVQSRAAPPAIEARRDDEPNRQDRVETIELEDDTLPGFWEGSRLTLKPRTYFLHRDRDENPDNAGWALGGALEFRSGWGFERLQAGATLFTSQKLYGPEDKDGTLLFKPGQEPFTVLGEAFLTARLGKDHGLRIGRQTFDLPYLSRHDIRMVPNTFEAVAVGRQAKQGLAYIAGYVDAIKRKNDDEFIPMSEAAGAAGSDEGVAMAGAQYTFADGSLVGAIGQRSFEVMDTWFVKGEKSFELDEDLSLRLYAQYTDQRSTGDALIGEFSTHLAAAMGELFFANGSLRLAASQAGSGRGIQSPFGGPPNYLAIIVDNFDRAGERSWMVGASYDFAGAGVEGLSLFSNFASGNTPDSGPNASPDETEFDLTVDYKFPKSSRLSGLWLRTRGAWINQDEAAGGDDFFDFRIIVNYTWNLF